MDADGQGLGRASAVDEVRDYDPRRRMLVVAVVAVAFVLELLDSTIVNVAAPAIQREFSGPSVIQWLVAGYSLSFAVLLITGGRLGDAYGYRRLFIVGVCAFTFASFLCGVATTPGLLIGARILQGGAAAIMAPQVLALVQILYPAGERVAVMGLFGLLGGVSAILGPIVGGLLIDADLWGLSWRPIFLINIPIGLAGAIVGARLLPGGRSHRDRPPDWLGTALLGFAMFALLLPLITAESGWTPIKAALLAMSGVAGVAFIWTMRRAVRTGGPMLLDPSLFANRAFSAGLLVTLAFQAAMGSLLLTFTVTLQKGLGFSPTAAALIHVPFAVGAGFSIAVLGRKLTPRLGRLVVAIGLGLLLAGLPLIALALRHMAADGHLWIVVPPLLILGTGMGLVAGALSPLALSETDLGHAGAASGVLSATQQLGSAVGVALIGGLFFSGARGLGASGQLPAFAIALWAMAGALVLAAVVCLGLPRRLARAHPPAR